MTKPTDVLDTVRAYEEWRGEHYLAGEEALERYAAHLEVQALRETIEAVRDALDGRDEGEALAAVRQAVSRVIS